MILYNLKKLSEEERYERHMLIQKFAEFDPYFQYLPDLINPTNNCKKYSNKDLAGMLVSITKGVPVGSEAARLQGLYKQFCLEYDDIRIQMGIIPKEEVIQLPRYQTKTSSYHEKYKTNYEEQFDDVIEFETQADAEQFLAFSIKFGLKISAKYNKSMDVSQQQEEAENKKKKKKYVKKSAKQSLSLPSDTPPSVKLQRKNDHNIETVNCFELNALYALVETERNSNITFEYQWLGTLPTQVYKISLVNQKLSISENNHQVTFTIPRFVSNRTFLTFTQQKDKVVRACVGWESYQGKYKLNHSMELPFEGIGLDHNQGVYFQYDQAENEWIIASHLFAYKQQEKKEETKVDKMVSELISDWQADNLRHQGQVQQILMEVPQEELYFSFLKHISSKDKAKIQKRISLFSFLLSEKFNYSSFIKAWNRILQYLHDKYEEFPYLKATLAKIMKLLLLRQGQIHDLFLVEEQKKEIRDFIRGIFQRYYYYSKDANAKLFVKTKNDFSDLL